MPQPTISMVHVDRPLTNIAIAYWQAVTEFIASKVFPLVPVDKQSDKYFTLAKGQWFRDEAQKRAPGTESAGSGFELSTDSYFCENYAFHKDLPVEIARNADLALETSVTEFVMRKVLLKLEKLFADTYITTGVWGIDAQGVSGTPGATEFKQWDQSAATPAKNIKTVKRLIHKATGFMPNTLVITGDVIDVLTECPDVLDRVKYTGQGGFVTNDQLKAYFGIENIHVLQTVINTAAEGAADAMTYTASKKVWLGYVAPNPGRFVPSAGYTFNWSAMTGGSQVLMRRFELEKEMATRYEDHAYVDQKVVGADLGALLYDAIA